MLTIISINERKQCESDYLFFLLKELRKYSTEIIACISDYAEQELLTRLSCVTDRMYSYVTDVDINRWRDVIVNREGWDYINNQDRILLLNDSFFGPFYSLDSFFFADDSAIDFWGMTEHGPMKYVMDGGIEEWPRFIQCYFLVLNRSLFSTEAFVRYLEELPFFDTFENAARGFEYLFTQHFEKLGFTWQVKVETRDFECEDSRFFQSPIIFDIDELVRKRNYPFAPKVIFEIENCVLQSQGLAYDVRHLLEYLVDNSQYDLGLIYNNLIKRLNVHDLLTNLNLNYVVQEQEDFAPLKIDKIGIFAYLFYEDLFDYSVKKLRNVPIETDIYIATDSVCKAKIIQEKLDAILPEYHVKVLVHTSRGRDISALLITFRPFILQYDIVGFLHDKKSSQMRFYTVGKGFNEWIWENMLFNKEYVNGVLKLFDMNSYLGFLCPPPVYHGMYFHTAIDTWTICYDITRDTAERLNLKLLLDKEKGPDFLGSVFWCRTDALRKLFEFEFRNEDFPEEPLPVDGSFNHAIERLFPYIAQEAGFLSGIIMNIEYAQMNYNNLREGFLQLMKRVNLSGNIDTATLYTTLKGLETSYGNS